ncbi:MAG TPA: helix-turn-helix domain-containing protein [Halococcus sp.]|nr:helix-turn-helix domain-containing protein [Halococcus sp.]
MAESTSVESTQTPQSSVTTTDASTARFDVPATAFAFADLFERIPDARVELDTTVAMPDDHTLLVVRTDGCEYTVDTALRLAQSVKTAERFDEREDGWTYRVRWKGRPRRFIQRLVAADVTLLSANGQSCRWTFRLLAPDRTGISRAHDIMADLDCEADCQRISTFEGGETDSTGLTDEQREALVAAFEAGYYDIPRNVTADDVADSLDISHQALSERFRRAYRHIVETEFAVEGRYS